MPKIKILNPLTIPDWDERIAAFPHASIFHSAAWARVLIESYGFVPHYCAAYQGAELTGMLPLMEVRDILGRKKAVSLPFTDFCEPLFNNADDFNTTFAELTSLAQNRTWRSFEIRGGEQWLGHAPAFDTMFMHEIDLTPTPDAIFKSFADTNRRNIRKAEKSGISVTHENSLDATRVFFRLNCLTRREHGLPPQPWKFFRKLWDAIISRGKGFVTIASHQGRAIAGNVYLTFGNRALYKYGASDRAFQHLRASNLVMWEGIKHCKELGCGLLHLGRTEHHHTGLLQYKRGFGGREYASKYFRYNCASKKFILPKYKQLTGIQGQLFSHLPLLALRLIGRIAYRYAA